MQPVFDLVMHYRKRLKKQVPVLLKNIYEQIIYKHILNSRRPSENRKPILGRPPNNRQNSEIPNFYFFNTIKDSMKPLTVSLLLLLLPFATIAEDDFFDILNEDFNTNSTEKNYVSLDGSVTFNTIRAIKNDSLRRVEHAYAGAYALKESIFDNVPMYGRIGVGMSLLSNPRYLSANFEISSGIRLPGTWSLYWGIGGIFGEIVECMWCEDKSDDNGFVGVFPEFGSNIEVTKTIRLGVFMRNYFLSDGLDDFFVYGGSISFLND